MRTTIRGIGITLLILGFIAVLQQPVEAFYWGIALRFGHNPLNSASPTGGPLAPDGGQQDTGIDYPNSSTRYIYTEGSTVGWTGGEVSYIQSHTDWQEALVFHAFVPNSNGQCANFSYAGGWSNLPGVQVSTKSTCNGPVNEVRFGITQPGSLSSSQTYYAQTAYQDNNYPGSKTTGEFDISSYWIAPPWQFWNTQKDFMQKECVSSSDVFTNCF